MGFLVDKAGEEEGVQHRLRTNQTSVRLHSTRVRPLATSFLEAEGDEVRLQVVVA
jgi:hypothetical protein